MKKRKQKILLTTGDPNGIGPEIILKIFSDNKFTSMFDLFISGNKKIFDIYSDILNIKTISPDRLINLKLPKGFKLTPGKIQKSAGEFSGDSINQSVRLCMEKKFDAVVTMPISKESLNLGNYKYPGHTEMLKDITKSEDAVMILYSKKFSVAMITGHIPVSGISKLINEKNSEQSISEKIITVNNSLVADLGKKSPRIGILALNPHAGDGGLLGTEEYEILSPVIEELNSVGFNARGPFAADAYFANRIYKKFDITIAMYHDQGLIPFKMISFGMGVNYTAGLNIVRTSPDHGTAFDIAGLGRAEVESTKQAILLAAEISKRRN
ncbi:MAG TPA: 4-hydroxythreonine-4-phosphate dehydrogenase PdxA [Ignavibacteria bacterium]|nr:4-hydroxythreonine-4-phosphate dehydrogenase PdxA [Ignavibacteria bacterium]HQY53068.1 4-hydroxythreonine-4-phosphate dehydrogenase PdxA [Ignavibacteria bacterium]